VVSRNAEKGDTQQAITHSQTHTHTMLQEMRFNLEERERERERARARERVRERARERERERERAMLQEMRFNLLHNSGGGPRTNNNNKKRRRSLLEATETVTRQYVLLVQKYWLCWYRRPRGSGAIKKKSNAEAFLRRQNP
jgi:hypothetical protein